MVYCVALGIQQVLDALYYELMLVRHYRFVSKAHTHTNNNTISCPSTHVFLISAICPNWFQLSETNLF